MSDDQHNQVPPNHSYQVLRKLQQHIRSNIPAVMAQRATSSFSLQEEPIPHQVTDAVFVVVYPQNPFVGEPEVRVMYGEDIRKGLVNSRVQVHDSGGVLALPDEDGNYIYSPGEPEFDQVNAFYYTTLTLRMYERYAQRQIPWSFPTARITIDPHAGTSANAYYNEQEQLLGFHSYRTHNNTMRSTAQSADIVSHEAAHAVLDGLRDLYNESFGLGARAFHESFGDITAVLVALHDDSLIRRVLEWTEGDLHMSNFISELAEHLTDELLNSDHLQAHSIYLRNAMNRFMKVPFEDLQPFANNPATELARNEHNYSRLFTGAIYDILIEIYERFREKNLPQFVALHQARDIVGYLLINAIELGPVGELNFADMARAMLSADLIIYNSRYHAIIRVVFAKRQILSREEADAHRASLLNLPDIRLPKSINNALSSAQFLENDVIPQLNLPISEELIPLSAYRNADGQAYLTYFYSEKTALEGTQYGIHNGAHVDIFGGLTLMFDKYDRLRSLCYRPVTQTDIDQVRILIAELISTNRIVNQLYPPDTHFITTPDGLMIAGEPLGKAEGNKLVKYPVIFDEISYDMLDIQESLEHWQKNNS